MKTICIFFHLSYKVFKISDSKIVKCIGNYNNKKDQFLVGNQIEDVAKFGICNNEQKIAIDNPLNSPKCSFNAEFIKIGFSGPSGFVPYYEVCFNPKTLTPIYAKHHIYGAAMSDMTQCKRQDGFGVLGLPPSISKTNINGAYAGNGYDKGHLAPYADGIFNNWRLATNLYINVAPMSSTANRGYWLQIEEAARKSAAKNKKKLTILTGVYGSLKSIGKNVQVAVSEYIWKFVKEEIQGTGIVLIAPNDPQNTNAINLCPNICSGYGWTFSAVQIICCDITILKRQVPNFTIPSSEFQNIRTILRF